MQNLTTYPVVLSIAGSDCSGGAGIQADTKVISALGSYAASVITAVTVQNTTGVKSVYPISADIVEAQVRAVMDDLHPNAIKTGMLLNKEIIRVVCRTLRSYTDCPPIVCDPIMVSTSGHPLLCNEAIRLMSDELFPMTTLITPNLPEAETLTGLSIRTRADMERAARTLTERGCQAVLLKGGHREGERMMDFLCTAKGKSIWLEAQRTETRNTHGTGCSLSSAIASLLAQGYDLTTAVRQGKTYITRAIEAGAEVQIGHGKGPVNHLFSPIPLMKIKGNDHPLNPEKAK